MGESFLKDAIDRIVGLAAPAQVEFGDKLYSDRTLTLVDQEPSRPFTFCVSTLDGLVRIIKAECVMQALRIKVEGPREVTVYSPYIEVAGREYERYAPYKACTDVPPVTAGAPMDQGRAIIELQTLYGSTPDRDYLLDLISRIDITAGITSSDNGVTQEAVSRTGVVLKEQVTIKPIVQLQPYRTFLEVEQPVSDFLLRVDKEGRIALYEADGGAWKLEAKRRIAAWLTDALAKEVEQGRVVIVI